MSQHTPGPWTVARRLRATVEGTIEPTDFYSVEVPAVCGGGIALVRLAGLGEANARLIAQAPHLLKALRMQVNYTMRDGTPCACPAGRNEDEPRGTMPQVHSTACEMLRAALAKVDGVTP